MPLSECTHALTHTKKEKHQRKNIHCKRESPCLGFSILSRPMHNFRPYDIFQNQKTSINIVAPKAFVIQICFGGDINHNHHYYVAQSCLFLFLYFYFAVWRFPCIFHFPTHAMQFTESIAIEPNFQTDYATNSLRIFVNVNKVRSNSFSKENKIEIRCWTVCAFFWLMSKPTASASESLSFFVCLVVLGKSTHSHKIHMNTHTHKATPHVNCTSFV